MRNRRVDLKLTQEEVGTAARLHRTYVTDIENGLRNVSFLTLMRLAKALDCPLSLLIIETERLDGWEL
jgi:transcriptional regulator with XRE-family HTH domain